MKFKVGDRVKVNTRAGYKGIEGGTGEIKTIIGSIVLVEFDDHIGGHGGSEYGECRSGYGWYVEDVDCELLKPETIVIYKHNDTVVAKNTQTGKKAVAKCHPDDEFDFNIGAKVAFDRLLGREVKEEPKEEYYNSKVICVNANGMSFTTTGKIYEVVDGQFYDDAGNLRPTLGSVKSLEELNFYTLGMFIEVVE